MCHSLPPPTPDDDAMLHTRLMYSASVEPIIWVGRTLDYGVDIQNDRHVAQFLRCLSPPRFRRFPIFVEFGVLVTNNTLYSETITAVTDVYNQLAEALPKSMACQRIPLDFVSEVEFATRGEQFMRAYLKKKVPCLFSVLKTLYTSRSELARRAFGSVVEARIKELEIPSDDVDVKAELAFAYYFLAQHLDKIEPGSDVSFYNCRRPSLKCASTPPLFFLRRMRKQQIYTDLF